MHLEFLIQSQYSRSLELYHKRHKKDAETLLHAIEFERGERLDPSIVALCDEYARDVLGWVGYSPWLHTYSAVAGRFKEGWIPDNYYGKVVMPVIKRDYGSLSSIRSLSSNLFGTDLFPDIAYYANGFFTTTSPEIIPHNAIKEFIFGNTDRVVYKLNRSEKGQGITMFTKEDFSVDSILSAGNGVFQKYIEQHAFFNRFTANSVATIRITTVIEKTGRATCRAAYLRVASNSDSYVISKNAIKIPIDINTGDLLPKGYLPNMQTVERHADSGLIFAGMKMPDFRKCLAILCDLHMKMPFCICIGWDIILDKNGDIQIMEWNGRHNGIKFSEATTGPCFADLGWEKLWMKRH